MNVYINPYNLDSSPKMEPLEQLPQHTHMHFSNSVAHMDDENRMTLKKSHAGMHGTTYTHHPGRFAHM